MSHDVIIGIDLGTTYSCVGVWDWEHRRVEILPNESGNRTTPSYVSYTPQEVVVGDAAKAKQISNLEGTIHNAKRIIGRPFSQIRPEDAESWPFTIAAMEDKPRYAVRLKGEECKISPEQVSAAILAKMKEIAERFLGQQVTKAVVCVPAYFTEPQKQATKDAAYLAGLEVMKLLTEPTAAALAYGLDRKACEGAKRAKAQIDGLYVMVFDLGGGTFDVSVLKLDGRGSFVTKAVTGDFHLGGEDFDEALLREMARRLALHSPGTRLTPKSVRRLRAECERLKRTLSVSHEAVIDVELQGLEFTQTVTRPEFEALAEGLVGRVMDEVEAALELARIGKEEIDDVVLVGGSTRIPLVRERLQTFFVGKPLWTSINPDEAVAYGASIQAAALVKDKPPGAEAIGKLTLTSVTPLTLGLELSDGTLDVLIPRATKLPYFKSDVYTTAVDGQKSVIIKVYEGESKLACSNSLLGQFSLLLDHAPAGVPKVEVRFDITVDGLFMVSARDTATGRQTLINIQKPNLTDGEKDCILQLGQNILPSSAPVAAGQPPPSAPTVATLPAPGSPAPAGPTPQAPELAAGGPQAEPSASPSAAVAVEELYNIVFGVQQQVAMSQRLSVQEKASVSMTANECLQWLSAHPTPTDEEIRLQRQIFELQWAMVAPKV